MIPNLKIVNNNLSDDQQILLLLTTSVLRGLMRKENFKSLITSDILSS